MADGTGIAWTDATWNPVTGCSVVSAGCRHCYAMRLAGGRLRHHPSRAGLTRDTSAGPVWTGEVRLNEGWLDQPLRWQRPRRIFVCAHGDLFHESVPYEWIAAVFGVMAASPHTFQVLTKRPERALEWFAWLERAAERAGAVFHADDLGWRRGHILSAAAIRAGVKYRDRGRPGVAATDADVWPLPNVWLGVSVEDQATADERIPPLLQTPAAVRFISAEPLLGPVRLDKPAPRPSRYDDNGNGIEWIEEATWLWAPGGIDWVIVGGESGPRARPCEVDWIRSIVAQCRDAGVPAFVKQLGARPARYTYADSPGKAVNVAPLALRSRAGTDPAEWPADLRVREFPGDAPWGGR